MNTTKAHPSLLQTHGLALHNLGYRIVPIHAGSKAPRISNWQDAVASEATISKWSQTHTGVGILSADTVAIDIDCRDEVLTLHMLDFTRQRLGYTPHRIGMPPKALLPYKCETPFSKVKSKAFYSPDGQKHQLEILGKGQQFVTSHIHPDTRKPYIWHHADGTVTEVLTVPHTELPVITEDDAYALVAVFQRQCETRGWRQEVNTPLRSKLRPANAPRHKYTEQKIRKILTYIDPSPYDNWIKVGMILKREGFSLNLWDEWSKKSSNYEEGACLKKWDTFVEGGQA